MRPCLPFFAILLLAGCSANSEKRVAREAAAAMTGSPETQRDGQVTSDLTITRQFAGPDLGNLGAPGA